MVSAVAGRPVDSIGTTVGDKDIAFSARGYIAFAASECVIDDRASKIVPTGFGAKFLNARRADIDALHDDAAASRPHDFRSRCDAKMKHAGVGIVDDPTSNQIDQPFSGYKTYTDKGVGVAREVEGVATANCRRHRDWTKVKVKAAFAGAQLKCDVLEVGE